MARSGVAPPPQLPASETVCRWCGVHRVRLMEIEGAPWLCPTGCADTLQAPYYGHCQTCGREFNTGHKWHTEECWPCATREHAAMVAAYAGPTLKSTGYERDMRVKGASRRAYESQRKGVA